MKNIPGPLRTITADAFGACDTCGQPATIWPTGLMSVDRELDVFGCDYVNCPTCCPDTTGRLPATIDAGTEYDYITYLWFKGDE